MNKKAVLFDLDNTLYDYDRVHKLALKAVFNELRKHIEIKWDQFEKLFKISRREINRELSGTASAHNRVLYFQRLVEKTHESINPQVILKLYNAYWDTSLKEMFLRKDALDLLKSLKSENVKIAIVSDLTTNIQLRKIHKLGISKYVDVVVTSEEAGSEKPHSIMFLLALNKLGVSPSEAMMVGDNTVADIEGANFVGLDTVLLKKGPLARKSKEDYEKPNFVIKKLKDLKKILC